MSFARAQRSDLPEFGKLERPPSVCSLLSAPQERNPGSVGMLAPGNQTAEDTMVCQTGSEGTEHRQRRCEPTRIFQ